MKILESKLHSLERENDALKRRVEELETQNRTLRRAYDPRRAQPSSSIRRTGTDNAEATVPSYMRSTLASGSRVAPVEESSPVPSPHAATFGEQRLQYVDGKLVYPESLAEANFSKSTESSVAKIRDRGQPAWDNAESPSGDDWNSDYVGPSRGHKSGWPQYTCTWCDELDASVETTDNSLEARSRLRDEFQGSATSECLVPFKLHMRLLKSALRLAQETLWHALRGHWPDIQRRYYLEGPAQVKFGREELYSAFGDRMYPTEANAMCGHPRSSVISRLFDVVYLRNAVCHPGYSSSGRIDGLLQHAQALAVTLQDETRAFKIRKLRDTLQTEATKTYELIETTSELAVMVFAKPWPLHVQYFLDSIHPDLGCIFTSCSDAVKRAVREWKRRYIRPGELDPTYLANVARAKTFIQEKRMCKWSDRRNSWCCTTPESDVKPSIGSRRKST